MGYCTINQLQQVLAQTLTSSNASNMTGVPADLEEIGTSLNLNLITTDSANYYIQLADSQINAALSQQYNVPLKEICDYETILDNDIDEYNFTINTVDSSPLIPGDVIFLTDGINSEKEIIAEITDNIITVENILLNTYSAGTRILRIKYPDPIPNISARLAAAAIYDKYSKAQSEPSKSDYSEILKDYCNSELNNIREGRTILIGATRRGWRFANPNLVSRYGLQSPFDSDGTRTGDRK